MVKSNVYYFLSSMLRHSLLRRLKSDKIAVNNRIAKEVKSNPDAVLKPLTEPENPYKRLAKKKQFGLDRSFEDYHQINEYDEENRVAEREVMHFARFKVSSTYPTIKANYNVIKARL